MLASGEDVRAVGVSMKKLLIAFAEVLGFIVLLPACLFHAWTTPPTYPSIKEWPSGVGGQYPHRQLVDEWRWGWLNRWYGNVEDGVSGQQAWVWKADGTLVPYPTTFPTWVPEWVIAYAWSAWRNGANNIKRPLRK